MAGESLSLSELKDWYSAFNQVINDYSGGNINTLTPPVAGDKAESSDINDLYNRITAMSEETYLKTQPQLYNTAYTVTSTGQIISRTSAVTPIVDTIDGIATIKCRNLASFSHGVNTCGTNSSSCANTAKSCGTHGSGTHGNGYDFVSTFWALFYFENTNWSGGLNFASFTTGGHGNGAKGCGSLTSGTNTCGTNSCGSLTHTTCSFTTVTDILNTNNTATK